MKATPFQNLEPVCHKELIIENKIMSIFKDEYGDFRAGWIALFIVIFLAVIVIGGSWLDNNGVRVSTDNWDERNAPKELSIPVRVVGYIEYRDTDIHKKEKWVNYCEVKEAKKEMRKEMRIIWKEMKRGCK